MIACRLRSALSLLGLSLVLSCAGPADGATQHASPGSPPADGPADESIAVSVRPVERSALSEIYSTSATLRAERRATVTARTRGVLRRILVEEGDDVAEGQPLAILENDEQKIEFERATAARETTARELERSRKLKEQDLLSEEDFDATLRAAAEAERAADLAALVLSRTTVRAPFAGRILTRYLDRGGTISDGTPVFDLADVAPLYADVGVPERQIARLAVGQAVRLVVDSTGQAAEGRIERLAPEVDAETGTVKVTLTVPAAPGLRPGGFVRVDIVVDTHGDALVVPRSALVAEGRRWHLFRLAPGRDAVERLEVVRGFEEGERVEIVEAAGEGGALDAGDPVVVVGAAALSEGSRVRVLDDAESAEQQDHPPEDPGVAS